ncbi:MAG: single-stranded-DNA-specific exonuclease RecJ [Treponema sp.]|jgi:single-stranded-DNA-specific exonuclease|nr:single-stranded-DNA-specific exonuclease RecJ [Treponema sp.]
MLWNKTTLASEQIRSFAQQCSCDLLSASILIRRGMSDSAAVRSFFETKPEALYAPFLLPDMEKAVRRLYRAQEEHELLLVFGDRDVDGISATVILSSFLLSEGFRIEYRIPTENEPYGLTVDVIDSFADKGGTLIVTVDCGISNVREIAYARERGIDVIVTDHHNPQETLPDAVALVDPKGAQSRYPFPDLAGCGVAYKLVSALRFAKCSSWYDKPLCFLNIEQRPDAYLINSAIVKNLVIEQQISETVNPAPIEYSERLPLPSYLSGTPIFVWDSAVQQPLLESIFKDSVPVYDLRPELTAVLDGTAGKSLKELAEGGDLIRTLVRLWTELVQKKEPISSPDELQMVALGTIADIMPLQDENRLMVRLGLQAMGVRPRKGVSELIAHLNEPERPIKPATVSWFIAPTINAAGRMGKPELALDLFMNPDPVKRELLAQALSALNEDRKRLGTDAWDIAEKQAWTNLPLFSGNLAVAYSEAINRGVTGIIANRLTEHFNVPALVVSFSPQSAIGSVRSACGFDLHTLLSQCAGFFSDWGGHTCAAGFSMDRNQWDDFFEHLQKVAQTISLERKEKSINIDAELPHAFCTPDILTTVDKFEPYGEMNGELQFLMRDLIVESLIPIGRGVAKHVKLQLRAGAYVWPALYWNALSKVSGLREGAIVDIVGSFSRDWYRGNETRQITITDLKRHSPV